MAPPVAVVVKHGTALVPVLIHIRIRPPYCEDIVHTRALLGPVRLLTSAVAGAVWESPGGQPEEVQTGGSNHPHFSPFSSQWGGGASSPLPLPLPLHVHRPNVSSSCLMPHARLLPPPAA